MRQDRDPFWVRHPIVSLLGAIVLVTLMAWGGWAIKVALSPVKGAGDVIIKNNDADNRIQSQRKFEELYHGILAMDANLDTFAATVKAHPNDRVAQDNLNGNMIACRAQVANYNAEARKLTSKDWKSWDLPEEINLNDPATDCKPTGASS